MADTRQQVIADPYPVYPVAYNGSMTTGELLTIPNRHRREGDLDENEQLLVRVQNISNIYEGSEVTGTANAIIKVLDDTNSELFRVYSSRTEQFETPKQLKLYPMLTPEAGMSLIATIAYFNVIVFYKKPLDR